MATELDRLLAPYGGINAHRRDQQMSDVILNSEIKQQRVMGSVLPLLTSSTGLVFAAYLPERETQELRDRELAALQQTASDYDTLLAGIREQGLHHVHGLLMPGVDALSAPVFNAMGNIAAVLTVVGPTSIFHADEQGPAAQQLQAAAQAISWRMGYEPQ